MFSYSGFLLCRGDVVEIDTWFQGEGNIVSRRDWVIRMAKTGTVIGRGTRYDTNKLLTLAETLQRDGNTRIFPGADELITQSSFLFPSSFLPLPSSSLLFLPFLPLPSSSLLFLPSFPFLPLPSSSFPFLPLPSYLSSLFCFLLTFHLSSTSLLPFYLSNCLCFLCAAHG